MLAKEKKITLTLPKTKNINNLYFFEQNWLWLILLLPLPKKKQKQQKQKMNANSPCQSFSLHPLRFKQYIQNCLPTSLN